MRRNCELNNGCQRDSLAQQVMYGHVQTGGEHQRSAPHAPTLNAPLARFQLCEFIGNLATPLLSVAVRLIVALRPGFAIFVDAIKDVQKLKLSA